MNVNVGWSAFKHWRRRLWTRECKDYSPLPPYGRLWPRASLATLCSPVLEPAQVCPIVIIVPLASNDTFTYALVCDRWDGIAIGDEVKMLYNTNYL